eukprot:scaffold93659_cov30-Tisochrysis_lutea.AAC.5
MHSTRPCPESQPSEVSYNEQIDGARYEPTDEPGFCRRKGEGVHAVTRTEGQDLDNASSLQNVAGGEHGVEPLRAHASGVRGECRRTGHSPMFLMQRLPHRQSRLHVQQPHRHPRALAPALALRQW